MVIGSLFFLRQTRGYITSTPKSADFREKWRKSSKNERASCIPLPKIGERPYLAPSKTHFRARFYAHFWPLFAPYFCTPNPHSTPILIIYIFFLIPQTPNNSNIQLGKESPLNSNLDSNLQQYSNNKSMVIRIKMDDD